MFPSHQREIGTIAFQLLACLDDYQQKMDRLVHDGWEAELYAASAAEFDEMKNCAAAIPRLSAAWVELLIRRFEVTAKMWEVIDRKRPAAYCELMTLHAVHNQSVEALRMRARSFVPTQA